MPFITEFDDSNTTEWHQHRAHRISNPFHTFVDDFATLPRTGTPLLHLQCDCIPLRYSRTPVYSAHVPSHVIVLGAGESVRFETVSEYERVPAGFIALFSLSIL